MSLREYWLILKRRWIVLLAAVVAGLGTGGVAAVAITPMYESSATVVFTGHATTNGQDLAYVGNYVQSRMQTYRRIGLSSSSLRRVMADMRSKQNLDDFRDSVDIEVSQVNTVATVTATHRTPRTAAKTADALAKTFIGLVATIEGTDAEQTSVSADLVTKAEVPRQPYRPDIEVYLLVGLIFGLVVGTVVAVLREVLAGDSPAGEGN